MHEQKALRLVIGVSVAVLLLLCSAPAWGADASRTLLLVDDEYVLYRPGTERVVQPFHRHPANPVIKPDKPWDGEIAWTSVYRDPRTSRYQLWYQAYTGNAARQKTHRCVVVHEGWPYGGVGAEVADRVQRLAFDWLDAPILRVTTLDVPMPYNAKLEQLCMPQPGRVIDAVKRVVKRGRA